MVIPSGVAFFIKTGTIFGLKKWGKTALYNEETQKETTMLYVGIGFITVLLIATIDAHIS